MWQYVQLSRYPDWLAPAHAATRRASSGMAQPSTTAGHCPPLASCCDGNAYSGEQ